MPLIKHLNLPIGLDISDRRLKLAQVKLSHEKIKIQTLGKYRLHKGVIVNGEIKDEASFVQAVKSLIAKPFFGSINSSEVVASLPDTKTYIKLITIEKSPNRISDIINAEVEKHFPLSIKDIYFDWQIIKEDANKFDVLIGATSRDIVDQYINCLGKAKLSVVALEIESVPLCRSLLQEETKKFSGPFNKNYCIIDIGARRTSMTIYSKNTIIASVSLPISNDEVTNKIAATLDIKHSQAEKAKIICGLDKTQAQGIVYKLLSSMIIQLEDKITETLNFYNEHYPDRGEVSEIILCGGGGRIKNLDKIILEHTKISTTIGNSLRHISQVPNVVAKDLFSVLSNTTKPDNQSTVNYIAFTTAIGLALRNVYNKKI